MNPTDFLLSIGRAKTLTSHVEEINAKLTFYHVSPVNAMTQMFIAFVVNFLWVGAFVGLTYVSYWTLLAAPFVIYLFRGSRAARYLESVLMRKKLLQYENEVSQLLRKRSEYLQELRELTGLADRFLTHSNLSLFETFVKEGRASDFQSCAKLIS